MPLLSPEIQTGSQVEGTHAPPLSPPSLSKQVSKLSPQQPQEMSNKKRGPGRPPKNPKKSKTPIEPPKLPDVVDEIKVRLMSVPQSIMFMRYMRAICACIFINRVYVVCVFVVFCCLQSECGRLGKHLDMIGFLT